MNSLNSPVQRRALVRALGALPLLMVRTGARAEELTLAAAGVHALQRGGAILVMRHANTEPAAGLGDPSNFALYHCATQRNLSLEGREKAMQLGRALDRAQVRFSAVMSSEWCRCVDTAQLVFGATPSNWTALNYVFPDEPARTKAYGQVRAYASQWRGPDNLAIVTHTNNVLALTGKTAAMNQAFVLVPVPGGSEFTVLALN